MEGSTESLLRLILSFAFTLFYILIVINTQKFTLASKSVEKGMILEIAQSCQPKFLRLLTL